MTLPVSGRMFAIGIFVLDDPVHFIEEAEPPFFLQNSDFRDAGGRKMDERQLS
jgi:hypothetical protein